MTLDTTFDQWTRALAARLDRRRAVKLTAFGTGGVLLGALLGCGSDADDPMNPDPDPDPDPDPGPVVDSDRPVEGTDCDLDTATAGTLAAARAGLAGGDKRVFVSPGKCWRYRRYEQFGVDMTALERWNGFGYAPIAYSAESAAAGFVSGQVFGDQEIGGSPQWTLNRGANPKFVLEYDADGDAGPRRDTYERQGDRMLVTMEKDRDGSGELTTYAEFDVVRGGLHAGMPPFAAVRQTLTPQMATNGGITFVGCSADQQSKLKTLLDKALADGTKCLTDRGRDDIAKYILNNGLREFELTCKPNDSVGSHAEIDPFDVIFGTTNVSIDVFASFFGLGSEENQLNVLFHELMHTHTGAHIPALIGNSRLTEMDPAYACASLCFDPPNTAQKTQCACATCLKVKKCDSRCQQDKNGVALAPCLGDMGATCGITKLTMTYYSSSAVCDSECDSPAGCTPFDVSCDASR